MKSNKEAFVEKFGIDVFNSLIKHTTDIDLVKWFFNDYVEPLKEMPKKETGFAKLQIAKPNPIKAVEKLPDNKKKRKSSIDYTWYVDVIESFYLSGERTSKNFKLKDDFSPLEHCTSVQGLWYRFCKALEETDLGEVVKVRRYYQGTANECVVLENLEARKSSVTTYVYS